jgi:RND family efflux transporter MFP subunit
MGRAIDSNAADHARVTERDAQRPLAGVNPIMILPSRAGGEIVPGKIHGETTVMRSKRICVLHVCVLASAFLLAGCEQNTYVPPPPPRVAVATPVTQPVTRYLEATGSTAAVNSANLVARVQGFLQEIKYRDGDLVKQGTTLFVIEPEPYQLKLSQSQAAEASADASLKQTQAEYERQSDLASRQIASKQTFDQAVANRDAASAKVKQSQADTRQAQINLDYTQVKAPFDGIVTARQVSLGELVGGGTSPTVLATIIQHDPIYVNFTISEQDVLHVRAEIARRGVMIEELRKIPVEVGLQIEDGYPHKGLLDYAAPSVSASTGTLTARAILQNADRALLPGLFARVRIPKGPPQEALLVPDAALGSDQTGRYVLVVNKDNVVEQRKVAIGPTVGELRVIESGLNADDRVVVAGMQRAVPGQKVDPHVQSVAPAPATTAPSAAAQPK